MADAAAPREVRPGEVRPVAPEDREAGRWKKGVSGNPGGRPTGYAEVVKLARSYTKAVMSRLYLIAMRRDNAAGVRAAEIILERGWGKAPVATDPAGDAAKAMTLEDSAREIEKANEAVDMARRDGVLAGKPKMPVPESTQVAREGIPWDAGSAGPAEAAPPQDAEEPEDGAQDWDETADALEEVREAEAPVAPTNGNGHNGHRRGLPGIDF